jgi:hypothetical protein
MATVGTNSYISVEDVKAWAALFGYDISAYTDPDISAATVRTALNFIDPNYTFKGTKSVSTQAMQLPSTEVAIADINNAAAQAVYQDLLGFLFVDLTKQSLNGDVESESKGLGPMKKSVSYKSGTARSSKYDTSIIDDLLRPFLNVSSSGFNSLRVL